MEHNNNERLDRLIKKSEDYVRLHGFKEFIIRNIVILVDNQNYMIRLLEEIIEGRQSSNSKNADIVKNMMKPIFDNPLFANNPSVKPVKDIIDNLGK